MKALGIAKKAVGKIEIFHDHLYVAVDSSAAEYVASEIDGASYNRRRLKAEINL